MSTKKKMCESCLLPLDKDLGVRESENYCSYCFRNGKLAYDGDDLKEFQKLCYNAMVEKGMKKVVAKFYTFIIRFAPRWKK